MHSLRVEKEYMIKDGVKPELLEMPIVVRLFNALDQKSPSGEINPWTGFHLRIRDSYHYEVNADGGLLLRSQRTTVVPPTIECPEETEEIEELRYTIAPNGVITFEHGTLMDDGSILSHD